MVKSDPVNMKVMVIYRLKTGTEDRFLPLLKVHWPTLDRMGLVTPEPAKAWRAEDKQDRVAYIESFEWKDPSSPDVAHQTPEVMKVWEPMGEFLEDLDIYRVEPARL
jgi:hypothetical protein